jgi:peptidyl-prolyl cis-trans isomerase B (cyclophilin B)
MVRIKLAVVLLALAVLSTASAAQQAAAGAAGATVLVVETVKGSFEIETFPTDAPKSVARILELVRTNFYRGQRVHGVSEGIIEFGDPTSRNMQKMPDWGLTGSGKRIGVKEVSKRAFERGVVGYAFPKDGRAEDADSQLFVLKIGNPGLNGKYAPIGRVTRGMDVVDKLQRADVIRNITVKAAAASAPATR